MSGMEVDISHSEGIGKTKITIKKSSDIEEIRQIALSLISYLEKSNFDNKRENANTQKDMNIEEGIRITGDKCV
jgi:hypothetical protein